MINKKEIALIIATSLILAFSITLLESTKAFLCALLSVFIILLVNIIGKKITAYYLESEIELDFWGIKQYGFRPNFKFKKPAQIGVFLPIISKIFLYPIQNFVWMASLVFEVKPKVYRAAKRHGLYEFSEMTEYHLGVIAATGILINVLFAIIGYLTGFTDFAKLNLYFAFFNLIPISNLDGNKIFFGSIILWSFLTAIILIGLFCIAFII